MKLSVDASKCTACRSCELICSFGKLQKFNPNRSRIKVVELDYLGFSNPAVCIQCQKPACVNACPTNALTKTSLGTISLDQENCNGCRLCGAACLFGGIRFEPATGMPLICDLCGGKPLCVDWCHTGALKTVGTAEVGDNALRYTLSRAKAFVTKHGLPQSELDWYKEKFC